MKAHYLIATAIFALTAHAAIGETITKKGTDSAGRSCEVTIEKRADGTIVSSGGSSAGTSSSAGTLSSSSSAGGSSVTVGAGNGSVSSSSTTGPGRSSASTVTVNGCSVSTSTP